MKLIRLFLCLSVSLFITLSSCNKEDESGSTPGNNTEVYDWKIQIIQTGEYNNFVKSISIDGNDDFDWLYNGLIMDLVQFGNNYDTITIENNDIKYNNIEIELNYFTNTGVDELNVSINVFKDNLLIDSKSNSFSQDWSSTLKY